MYPPSLTQWSCCRLQDILCHPSTLLTTFETRAAMLLCGTNQCGVHGQTLSHSRYSQAVELRSSPRLQTARVPPREDETDQAMRMFSLAISCTFMISPP